MPKLFVYPKKGESICLVLKNEKISVGRSPDNEIPLPDPFCSGHHAFIYPVESGYAVRDNASKNGTFLNGKKVQAETVLKKGDEILVGSTRIIFDKELSTNVEVTEAPSFAANVNTIIQVSDILKKTDVDTTLRATFTPSDLEKVKSEYKAYSILSDVSEALILHKPLTELLENIMDLICESLPMDRGILMLKEGNPPQFIPKVVRINNDNLKSQKIQVSQSIINTSVGKQASVLTYDAQADPRFSSKDSIIKFNIHSAMCVPLWNNREIIGIIYSDRITLLKQFTDNDLKLLTLISNLAAVKIENAKLIEKAIEQEKMEKELALAAKIQEDFLPKKSPECEKFEIAGSNIPCYQVGGDYYDFIDIDQNRLGIVIADVSGKGVSASLLMASLRAAIHSEVDARYKLKEMAAKLNDFVHRSSAPNTFITFFFCELDKKTGELKYLNAGHNPPVILDKKGKIHRMESCGLCLGMFPAVSYEVKKATLKPGDLALLYTDGIVECRNKNEEEFNEERLISQVQKNFKLPAQKILEKICDEINSFSSGRPQMDDMTLVIVKRTS